MATKTIAATTTLLTVPPHGRAEGKSAAGAFSETEIDVARQLVQLSGSSEDGDGEEDGGGAEASSGADRTNDSDGELVRKRRRYRSIESIYKSFRPTRTVVVREKEVVRPVGFKLHGDEEGRRQLV
ncbi:hypothetical protein MLD38_032182 [Melastoma candidum]|uniref:Uncharacterized protein n=1 Tax=Melastoma candidum TaxID=119954 RepID=A0ACB9M543_9MYRT|nr:hypothetical protein MLD38_032182 [Melastoma candidum]